MRKILTVSILLLFVFSACVPKDREVNTTDTTEEVVLVDKNTEMESDSPDEGRISDGGQSTVDTEQESKVEEVAFWLGVTTSRVKLRQGPSTETEALFINYDTYELEAPSYDFLFLGQGVRILDQSNEKETIGDYEPSYWYYVEASITDAYSVTGWVFGAFVDAWDEDMASAYAQTLANDYASARPLSHQINLKVANGYKVKREETLAEYPFLQADVSDYETYLLSLDMSDLSNLIPGAKKASSYAMKDNGDELLYAFSDFQEAVLELSIFNGYEYIVDHETFLEEVGFMVLYSEGYPEIYQDPAFTQTYFGDMISPIIGDHINLLVKEQEQHPGTYVFSDAAMTITWEDLAQRIRDNEGYVSLYGDDPIYDYVGDERRTMNDFYLRIYLGEFNMDNTPIYQWQDKTIHPEVIESYDRFLSNHPESKYAPLVEKVLTMFKNNDFIYDADTFEEVYDRLFEDVG